MKEPQHLRPRDDDRTAAILDSATELLLEMGYDKLRIQDVADRAGCGTGAIYRRWKTKEDLVAEAIRTMDEPEADETGDPIADLRNLIEGKAMEYYGDPDMLPGMIAAMRTHPVIADAVLQSIDLLASGTNSFTDHCAVGIEKGYLTGEQFDAWVIPGDMVHPG